MHSFKKALKATIVFIMLLAICCSVIIYPCMENGSDYNDSQARKELIGEIDYLFSGASHAYGAFCPLVIDEELNVCSWNLSSSSASLEGRKTILEKELKRNTVDTVVIDISFDTLSRSQRNEHATGEPMIICKLDNNVERVKYFFSNVSFVNNDYENVLSIFMRYGLKAWKSKLSGEYGMVQASKGFMPAESVNLYLNESEVVNLYNTKQQNYFFRKENVEILEDTVKMCKQYGARVIVVVIPISEASIWKRKNLDTFYENLSLLCEENECLLFDFNLMKNRNEIFTDKKSFVDETHMSEEGAIVFSKLFANTIKCLDLGEDTSDMFYASYNELKDNMNYMEIYSQHKEN